MLTLKDGKSILMMATPKEKAIELFVDTYGSKQAIRKYKTAYVQSEIGKQPKTAGLLSL